MNRLTYLRDMEGVGAVSLPGLVVGFLSQSRADWLLPCAAVVIVSLILLQGVFYWHLKLKCVKNRRTRLPSYFHKTFVTFRSLNLMLLGSFVLLSVFVLPGSNAGTDWVFVTWGLFALAVLEHINYYHYQLMHDNAQDMAYLWRHRRLRRSSLALDLIATRTVKEK